MLQIRRMPVGQIGTNCYLLEDPETKTCALIDPGDQANDIDRVIREAGLSLSMILITHGHFDHVLAVPGLVEKWPNTPVYVHNKEVNWEFKGDQYMLLAPIPEIKTLKEGDIIDFAGAGASVPLTGFGNLLAKGVKEAVEKKGFLGALTGGCISAAGGITAAIFAAFVVSLFFRAKPQK